MSQILHKNLLLIGGGHAHLQIIKNCQSWAPTGSRITLMSERPHTIYSGMLPGHLAGWYTREQIQVDLKKFCDQKGVAFVLGRALKVDFHSRQVLTETGITQPFDILSFDIGSKSAPFSAGSVPVYPLKPVGDFIERFAELLARLKSWSKPTPPHIAMVGGGASAFEITMVLARAVQGSKPTPQITIWEAGEFLSGHSGMVQRLARKELDKMDVRLRTGVRVTTADNGELMAEATDVRSGGGRGQGRSVHEPCDFIMLASNAFGADIFRASGIQTDDLGFMSVSVGLQSLSHPQVFGAGDCIAFPSPLPKSGVYAIRAAATLRQNLRQALLGEACRATYHPQKRALALMITGEKRAIASWGPLGWQSEGLWRWKDRIDTEFLKALTK